MKTLILIPTRNRSDLAQRALESCFAEAPADVIVVVSDNSDDDREVARLRDWCAGRRRENFHYLRPPEPLSMVRHWNWAIDEALRRFAPTHLGILTDRMVWRAGAFPVLLQAAAQRPDLALTFLHDRVNDVRRPVVLEPRQWSGTVCVLSSRALLDASAQCVFHQCLPRLLNSLVPSAALQRVAAVYGDYCGHLSPDFGFGFRYLATHAELLHYDGSLLTHSDMQRSNGTSMQRGILSPDARNFRRNWPGQVAMAHTPYPEFITVGNAILEEYLAARERAPAPPLRDVDRRAYRRLIAREIMQMEDPQARRAALADLGRRGDRWRTLVERWAWAATLRLQDAGRAVLRALFGAARFPPRPRFASAAEAIEYNRVHSAPRMPDLRHLRRFCPQALQRLEGVGEPGR